MDIHAIALTLYAQLVGAHRDTPLDAQTRMELAREAYCCAEAFIAAKDQYIRELPVAGVEDGY